TDNIAVIRDLVMKNMGVSIMAHSAYREDEAAGRLVSVPIDGVQMPRSIQIVYREDFEHAEVFSDVRRIYAMYDA
ncbi:MAG: LysR family transcriptional regulator substrate-binding protein, partial [Christensenellales bacterium]